MVMFFSSISLRLIHCSSRRVYVGLSSTKIHTMGLQCRDISKTTHTYLLPPALQQQERMLGTSFNGAMYLSCLTKIVPIRLHGSNMQQHHRLLSSTTTQNIIDSTDKSNHNEDTHTVGDHISTTAPINGIVPRTTRRSFGNGQQRHHRNNTMMNQFLLQQLKPEVIVPVRAIHAAQTIDLNILLSSAFQQNAIKKQMFGKNSIVIQLADDITTTPPTPTSTATQTKTTPTPTTKGDSGVSINESIFSPNNLTTIDHSNTGSTTASTSKTPKYMAVFRFGSIVYFNVEESIAKQLTCSIKKIASFGAVPVGHERKENFGVVVTRDMDISNNHVMMTTLLNDSHSIDNTSNEQLFLEPVTGDYCMVPELDMNGVAVIGTIMGQTVTLDSYSDSVEELLTNFARINSTVTQTGSFTSGDKSFLFKTVAQNNSIFIDMISKVRIKDRSDTAWNLTKYETIHYGLKEEFVRSTTSCFLSLFLLVATFFQKDCVT
jgi:uncharacterized Rmd1/YagE family protein